MKLRILLPIILIAFTGCESIPEKITAVNHGKLIGVIASYPEEITIPHYGITVFTNNFINVETSGWALNSKSQTLALELINSDGLLSAKPIKPDWPQEELLSVIPWDHVDFREIKNKKNAMIKLAQEESVDYLLFINQDNTGSNSSDFLSGYGLFQKGIRTYTYFAQQVLLIDGLDASIIARFDFYDSIPHEKLEYLKTATKLTEEQLEQLKIETYGLQKKAISSSLQNMGLTGLPASH